MNKKEIKEFEKILTKELRAAARQKGYKTIADLHIYTVKNNWYFSSFVSVAGTTLSVKLTVKPIIMRDHLKTEDCFIGYIERQYKRINNFMTDLNNGEIAEDRIESVEQQVTKIKLDIFYAKYSIGAPLDEIYNDFLNFLPKFYEKEYGIWSQ